MIFFFTKNSGSAEPAIIAYAEIENYSEDNSLQLDERETPGTVTFEGHFFAKKCVHIFNFYCSLLFLDTSSLQMLKYY